ncbi:MAG TPA: hypothetical protein VG076_02145 [Acidimicrobiales bacterium]|jgi:hypothetical protein|nr:hypothetical protein [Acidimicrobiales bacterium]
MVVQVEQTPKSPPTQLTPDAEPPRRNRLWRRVCVAVLLVLGFLLTPVAVLVTYGKTQILDTDRYVATVKPLASDPAIQNYIADTLTTNLLAQVDVKAYVNQALSAVQGAPALQALPGQGQAVQAQASQALQGLAGPISSAVESFVHQAVLRVVQSSQFQQLWVSGNRVAHAQIVKVLTGEGAAVTVSRDGAVKVDLKGLAGKVKDQLDSAGLTIVDKVPLDKVSGSITLFQSKELYQARSGAKALNTIGYALPFLVVACFGGAILLSVRKRRAFIKAAFFFAAGAVVLALLVNGARQPYLDALSKTLPHDAAAASYDTMLRSLHTSVRNILFVAIVIFLTAFMSGPARPAVAFRSWWGRLMTSMGTDADHVGWGILYASAWVSRSKRVLRIVLAVVLFVVAFRWPHPTSAVLFWLAVLGLIGLAVIDFYGREPTREAQSPASGGASPLQG